MKKILFIALCLTLLCGCASSRNLISQNGRFLVSAIGIDQVDDKIKVSVEAIIVNSQDTDLPPSAFVFESQDKTFAEAFEKAVFKSAKPLDFSHCAMIVFGIGAQQNIREEIYDFCLENEQITVSVGFAETENANRLLKTKPSSDITVGYEMAVMLETVFTENKVSYNNRLFEIQNAKLKGLKPKKLPFFKIGEQSFYIG